MDWIYSTDDPLLQTLAGSLIIFIVVITLTRIIGLRSFAKFTAYDFAFTIAIGSIISSILTSSTSIAHGSVAVGALLILTFIFSYLQRAVPAINKLISNKPLLLMDGSTILEENLKYARTGDISVLHTSSSDDDGVLNKALLDGVRKTP